MAARTPVVLTIAGLGALMSLALFGVFELVLPTSLQTKLSQVGGAGYRGDRRRRLRPGEGAGRGVAAPRRD